MTNTTDKAMREALELAREYVANASQRMYDGTNGHGIRKEASRRLEIIDAALASSAAAPEQVENLCPCKDRPADQCDEEWGPDCDLGNNAAYAQTAPVEVQGCADRPFLAGPPPLAGCRRAAHDLRGEGVTDNERSKA